MAKLKRPDWLGRTVVCIASGPSLTAEDCEAVRAAGHPSIVTNTTFRIAPWADVVFGHDAQWWKDHHEEVKRVCSGRLMSVSPAVIRLGIETTYGSQWFTGYGNTGTCAIALAVAGGAAKIVLIGYDCQKTGGRAHWHADHPGPMSNAKSIGMWPRKFAQVAAYAAAHQCRVLNASRSTALTCFERVKLVEALLEAAPAT